MTFNLKNFAKILFAVSIVGISAAQADETKCKYKALNPKSAVLKGKISKKIEITGSKTKETYTCSWGECGATDSATLESKYNNSFAGEAWVKCHQGDY